MTESSICTKDPCRLVNGRIFFRQEGTEKIIIKKKDDRQGKTGIGENAEGSYCNRKGYKKSEEFQDSAKLFADAAERLRELAEKESGNPDQIE